MVANMEPLLALLKRAACMAACLACLMTPARADDLDDFNRTVEAAMSHRRVAAGYLRTGNIDLAALEIEGMREAWGKVSTLPRPAAFADQERYTATMLEIAAGLVGTTLVLNLGRPDVARESLDAIRASLSRLRRENGVTVLADCVLDANTAMDALFAHDEKPDWESVAAGAAILSRRRCSAATARRRRVFAAMPSSAVSSTGRSPVSIKSRNRSKRATATCCTGC